MGAAIQISDGSRFHRFTVLSFFATVDGHRVWNCRCDCGKELTVRGSALIAGHVHSCGCYKNEQTAKRGTRHGMVGTHTYDKWRAMRHRCGPRARGKGKINYYDKGIRVCDRWQKFENFLVDMGVCPDGMEIDRIDNSLGYQPRNCRWVTRAENQRNKSKVLCVTVGGVTKRLKEWAAQTGIAYQVLRYRLRSGWSSETVLTPIQHTDSYAKLHS